MEHDPAGARRGAEDRQAGGRWHVAPGLNARSWLPSRVQGAQPDQHRPAVLLAAFGGWRDAGGAASAAIETLTALPGRRRLAAWRGASTTPDAQRATEGWEDWHDLRVHRPRAFPGPDGRRHVAWPSVRVDRIQCSGPVDLLLASGPEPDIAWDRIVAHLLTLAAEEGAVAAIGLGAVTRDVPHTRPWPLTATSEDQGVRDTLNATVPQQSGPLGFIDVVLNAADAAGWPNLQLQVGVPSYAAGPPQPVARLRLLRTVDTLCSLGLELDQEEEDARAWLRGADRLAREDARVSALLRRWEADVDRSGWPEAGAEAIAAEVERFLRLREQDSPE